MPVYIRYLVERMTVEWGYDELYSNTRGLFAESLRYNPGIIAP